MMIWEPIKKKIALDGRQKVGGCIRNLSGVKRKSNEKKNQWKRSRGKKETMSHVCVWRWSSFKHIVPVTAAEHLWWIAWKENDSSASVLSCFRHTYLLPHWLYFLPRHFLLLPMQYTYYYIHITPTHTFLTEYDPSPPLPRLHNHQKVINQMRGWCEEKRKNQPPKALLCMPDPRWTCT